MTICKTQGANIKKLIEWFDCTTVPSGMGYVALSRIRKSEDIKIMTPMVADQLTPVLTWKPILSHVNQPFLCSASVTRSWWMLHISTSLFIAILLSTTLAVAIFTESHWHHSIVRTRLSSTSVALSTATCFQIAADQRYTYPLKGHYWPANVQSHPQLFLCTYVTTQPKSVDARGEDGC